MSLSGVAEVAKALDSLQKANARTFLRIWASIPASDRAEMLAHLTPLVYDLVRQGHEDAITLGLHQLSVQRSGVPLPSEIASPPNRDQVAESLRFLLAARGAEKLRESVWGMIDRQIRAGHRDTITLSSLAAGNGFARKPEASACDFCLMLASRGAVYRTRQAAFSVGAPGVVMHGNQSAGDRFHDHCKCTVVEVSEGDGLPPEAVKLRKKWIETFYPGGDQLLPATDFESTNPIWREALKTLKTG